MWIARTDYERVVFELATMRATVLQLEIRVTQAQAGREWMETRINSLEVERAALTERLLQVSFPVPQIIRENEVTPRPLEAHGRPVEDLEIPPHLRDSMSKVPRFADPASAQRGTRPKPATADNYESSVSALQASELSFEDMGDQAASMMGVKHDPAGNIVHER